MRVTLLLHPAPPVWNVQILPPPFIVWFNIISGSYADGLYVLDEYCGLITNDDISGVDVEVGVEVDVDVGVDVDVEVDVDVDV